MDHSKPITVINTKQVVSSVRLGTSHSFRFNLGSSAFLTPATCFFVFLTFPHHFLPLHTSAAPRAMATATPAPPAYDDGSSTESEYYFDPAEEAQELAAYAWAHAQDAPAAPSPPGPAKSGDNIALKQKRRDNITIKQELHDNIAIKHDNITVERVFRHNSTREELALPRGSEWSHGAASADGCGGAVERALALAGRFEREAREEALTADTITGNEQEEEQVQETQVKKMTRSLSSSGEAAKVRSKIVSLKSVKAPSSSPKMAGSSVVVGLRRPPTKVLGAPSDLENGLAVARPQWKATGSRSSPKQSPALSKVVNATNGEKSAVATRERTKRSKSPSVMRRTIEKVASGRTERSRSPRRRERAHKIGGRSVRLDIDTTDLDPRRASRRESTASRVTQYDRNGAIGHRAQDNKLVQSAKISQTKEDQILTKQVSNKTDSQHYVSNGETSTRGQFKCDTGKPLIESTASFALRNVNNAKKTPNIPRPKIQEVVGAHHHKTHHKPVKKPSRCHNIQDEFERQVHKLKLREADLDEKETAGTCDEHESWRWGNRRRGIAEEKARLEAQNLERFEALYNALTVSQEELERYQTSRDFAYRVVCYKRKQATLQQQTGVFQAPEEKASQWRLLEKERELLIAENSELFHNVMMTQHELGRTHEQRSNDSEPKKTGKHPRCSDKHDRQPFLKRIARGRTATHRQPAASSTSRVIVGAALQHSGGSSLPSQTTPWFLKG
ncbi:unnamed protein product [Phytophthora fragariaefolia]|uniref:Unnamed protein product n=1 Tax=Phytophthora fragariaefolia TaxID=1490495 RepID=A0A9W7D1Z7_9STRA|nr:unnamed protein product [Phytophthora fragariaefolia]